MQDEIVAKLLKSEADDLQKKVADAVRQKLADAYAAAGKNAPTTRPSAAPATQPTTDIAAAPTTQPSGSFSYADLERIREEIQKQFNVSLEITQVAEWQDATSVAALTGIGTSEADKIDFGDFVSENAAPFVTNPLHNKSAALQIGQPSPLFTAIRN